MNPSDFATSIASQGLLGILLVVVGWVAWRKDQDLKAERDVSDKALAEERKARVEDAKGYADLTLKLQAQVIDAIHKLSDILDEMKRIMPRGDR